MRLVALLVALAACGNKNADSSAKQCADAAQRGVDAMIARAKQRIATAQMPDEMRAKMAERAKAFDEMGPKLRAVITNRCVEDKWQADVIGCYAKAASMDDMRTCRAKLSVEQQARLQKEEQELMAGAMDAPGSAAPSANDVIAKLQAELTELDKQIETAVTAVTDATNQAERDAAATKLQQLRADKDALQARLAAVRQQ